MRPVLRTALVLALPLSLAACGDKDDTGANTDSPCEQYKGAEASCLEAHGESLADDGFCEDYPSGSALDASFSCYAAILDSADCSTAEGYSVAMNEAGEDC